MGLGKTVQTVAMIAYLTEFKDAPGPHMVKQLWREAGPPNHHDDKVDSDQCNKEEEEEVQTVAMIAYLTEFKDAPGPHMVKQLRLQGYLAHKKLRPPLRSP